jgi:di/tricarboxylate transporter
MGWEAWFSIGTVAAAFALLALTRIGPDLILLSALGLVVVAGVLPPEKALAGFANEGMITVGVLFVVAAGLRETGGLAWIAQRILGAPRSVGGAQVRLMLPVAFMSAFLNNTPIVAMALPVVGDWARKHLFPLSKLLIPLSYSAILGGVCTLIGTSTNLVVSGLMIDAGLPRMGIFDISWVGVPCAFAGLAFLLLFSRWLLPDRSALARSLENPREYTLEMIVDPGGPLAGKTVEAAGLRHLSGGFLVEIDRDGEVLPAVGPEERLRANDRLVFAGVVESMVDLQKIRGLTPAMDHVFRLDGRRSERVLIEAVVSDACPLVGRSIREGHFRTIYEAAVLAVSRHGERIRSKIGDIVLRAGDTLLLEARPSFVDRHRNSRDFFLVSRLDGSAPPRHDRAWAAIAILAGMVALAASGLLTMLQAAIVAAAAMLLTRCVGGESARRSVHWTLLLSIAAAFGLGRALESSGAAAAIADRLLGFAGSDPWAAFVLIYLTTTLFTEFMTNNAAAVIMFPIAVATASTLQVSPVPYAVGIMVAASCSFATPLGYQTNLMVYGPGGYRVADFLRIGIPLNLLVMAVTVTITPLIWPLS